MTTKKQPCGMLEAEKSF